MKCYWSLGGLVTGLLTSLFHASAAADSESISITSSAPLTSNLARAPAPSVCCFVFQDTVTELWAELYTTSIFAKIVNITSYTVRVTPGPKTAETSIETNVYTTNASFTSLVEVGTNPISLYNNVVPGPSETSALYMKNATQIVTHGVTVPSPQAIYIYSSVKIVTALPVTDSAGNVVCATPSSVLGGQVTINSNAQAFYYGLTSVSTFTTRVGLATTATATYVVSYDNTPHGKAATVSETTITQTTAPTETFLINSNNQSIAIPTTRPPGVMLTFETPFVYQPKSGASGLTHSGAGNCYRGTNSEGWGYPPQTLLDYMVKNPAISKQYPGLEACYPGGPSIITSATCSMIAPVFQFAGGDLTETTTLTVTGDSVPTAIAITQDPAPEPTMAPPPPQTSAPAPSNQGADAQAPTGDAGAIASAIAGGVGVTQNPAPITRTLPGRTTLIDGTLHVVIPATTVLVNSNLPQLSGSSTVISGESYVVITSETTVPVVSGQPTAPSQLTAGSGTVALKVNSFVLAVFSGICVLVL